MVKRITSALLALAMVLTLALPAAADSVSLKEELEQLEQEQSQIRSELDAIASEKAANWNSIEELVEHKDDLDRQIGLLHTEVQNLNAQIDSYTQLVEASKQELEAAQNTLDSLKAENREQEELTLWSAIFQAKSFSDLLDRLGRMMEGREADRSRMAQLDAATEAVATAKGNLEQGKKAMEARKAQLDLRRYELQRKSEESEKLLSELNRNKEALQELEDQYEAEESRLSAQIAAAEMEYTLSLRGDGGPWGSSNPQTGVPVKENWGRPCIWTRMTSSWGYRTHPTTGQWKFHNGVDLAAPMGTPIRAARTGTVTVATYGNTYGNYVTINHADGFSSLYAHMTYYVVRTGDYVCKGDIIGYVGSTGRSTGPHLHFSVFYNGESVNPMNYI